MVAYYQEVLAGNCPELEGKKFIYDYVGIHRPKDFVHKMAKEVLPLSLIHIFRADAGHVQRFVKALAQHGAEGERAAQIKDIALDGATLCQTCLLYTSHALRGKESFPVQIPQAKNSTGQKMVYPVQFS